MSTKELPPWLSEQTLAGHRVERSSRVESPDSAPKSASPRPHASATSRSSLSNRRHPVAHHRLGLDAERGRGTRTGDTNGSSAELKGPRHLGFRDVRAQGAARSWSPTGGPTNGFVVANLLASAGGKHVGLRLPDRRDHLPAADLGPLLHLARDPANRVCRSQLEPGRTLGHPAGTQPRHRVRGRAAVPVPHP